MVVIVIIGVLMAILLPVLSKVRGEAKIAAVKGEIAKIAGACHSYQSDYGFFPPDKFPDSDLADDGSGHLRGVDLPAEALWFYLSKKFQYKTSIDYFNEYNGDNRTGGVHTGRPAWSDRYRMDQQTIYGTKTSGPLFSPKGEHLRNLDVGSDYNDDYNDNGTTTTSEVVYSICDVWGQPYLYNAPGGRGGNPVHNTSSFDLFSVGPNGRTRQADATERFSDRVIKTQGEDYHAWVDWCLHNSGEGGNDVPGGNSLIPANDQYIQSDQDDINNW
jgi:type II secretory pathway pseudopilin PulG